MNKESGYPTDKGLEFRFPTEDLDPEVSLLRDVLLQIAPSVLADNWLDVEKKIEEEIGPTAAEIYYCFTEFTNKELRFIYNVAKEMLSRGENQNQE